MINDNLNAFFNPNEVINCAAFGSGHIHHTFNVKTQQGNFILQKMNTSIFKNPAGIQENIEKTANFLKQQPYQLEILTIYPTLEGKLLYENKEGETWRVFPFIEHSMSFNKAETPEQAYEAAKAFAHFTKHLDKFDSTQLHNTLPNFHDISLRWQQLLEAIKENKAKRLSYVEKELSFLLEYQWIEAEFAKRIATLPLRATHHDTKINNVLFDARNGKGLCVVDLDTLMPGYITSDFGDMVRTFTPSVDEDERYESPVLRTDILDALMEGFLSELGDLLTAAEKENLIYGAKLLIFMQSVRFLADYLNGDVYYHTHYPEQNLYRARHQMVLLKQITI